MSKEEKKKFENALENGINTTNADYCPTTFQRDKILKFINIVMFVMLLPLAASYFIKDTQILQNLWSYQLYTTYGVICLNVVYFFYAQYEGKLYVACDSCQLGNIVATTVISLMKLAIIITASYFLLHVT